MTTVCNLHCSYCTQRDKKERGRAPAAAAGFLAAFARLPGRWEIKLSGGEPFCHPQLDAIVAGLAALGHRVSMVTNFTASRERLAAWLAAAAGRVGVVACSLHLEHVAGEDALAEFFARARWFADRLICSADPALPKPNLCVTSVATRAALPMLSRLADRCRAAGLVFKVQPEKQDREVIAYRPDERAAIIALGGHNLTGAIAPGFRDRPCWAGCRYFVLDDLGSAWRCYPARRFRRDGLGDFTRVDFHLLAGASPCSYDYCNCTVPIARGMMPRGEEMPKGEEEA